MALVSRTEFARMCGILPTSLAYPFKKGLLTQDQNFRMDTEETRNMLFLQRSKVDAAKKAAQPAPEPPRAPEPPKPQHRPPGRPKKQADPLELSSPDELMKYSLAKLKAEARQKELKNAELVRKLIPRTMVDHLFSKFITTVSTHLLTSGDRLSLQILGIVGSDDPETRTALKIAVEKDIEQALSALKQVVDEFATDVETSSVEYDVEADD